MRSTVASILLLALAGTALPAPGGPSKDPLRLLVRANKYLKQGERIVDSAKKVDRDAERIRVLRRSRWYFRRSRTLAGDALARADVTLRTRILKTQRAATRALVGVLDDEAAYLIGRGSYAGARKRLAEALKLIPGHPRSRGLLRLAEDAESVDIYERNDGTAAIRRIRARRAAIGAPLRNRGRARRE